MAIEGFTLKWARRTDGRKGVKREKWRKWWRREENFLRKSSQALGSSENALRLVVSFPLSLILYL